MLLDAIAHPAWSNATCPEVRTQSKKKNKTKKQRLFQNGLDFIGVRVCGRISPLTALPASSAECKSIGPAGLCQKVAGGKGFPLSRSRSAPEHLSVGITHEENSRRATSFGGMSALGHHGPLDTFWTDSRRKRRRRRSWRRKRRSRRKRSAPYGDDNEMLMGSDGPGRKKKAFCVPNLSNQLLESICQQGDEEQPGGGPSKNGKWVKREMARNIKKNKKPKSFNNWSELGMYLLGLSKSTR